MSHALRHLTQRGLSRGFASWASAWREESLMRRVLQHITQKGLSRAFAGWASAWREDSVKLEVMRRALRRLRNRDLSLAWMALLAERAAALVALWRAARVLLNLRGVRALKTWRWAAQVVLQGRGRLAQVVRQIMNRELSRGFVAWVVSVISKEESRREKQALHQTFGHLGNHDLAMGFHRWLGMIVSRAEGLLTLLRALQVLRNTQVARALKTWRWAAQGVLQGRRRLAQAVRQIMHRELSRGFVAWVVSVISEVEKQALHRALGHLGNHDLAMGFRRWLGMIVSHAEGLLTLLRAVQVLRNTQVARALKTWRSAALGSAPHRTTERRALRHLTQRELSRGFAGWALVWREASGEREVMHRVLGHLRSRELSLRWGRWMGRLAAHASRVAQLRRAAKVKQLTLGWDLTRSGSDLN